MYFVQEELSVSPADSQISPLEITTPSMPTSGERAGSAYLFGSVAESMGVELAPQERGDWKTLLAAAYAIDYIVDDEGKDIDSVVASFLAGGKLEGATNLITTNFRRYIETQPEERRALTIQRLGAIGSHVELCSQAESVTELITARQDEAELYASFFELPLNNTSDKSQRSIFNAWLHVFSRTGYLVDSLLDLKVDYEDGGTKVEPTVANRIMLARAAFRESVVLARQTPSVALVDILKVGYHYLILGVGPEAQ
ncbi:MAG TPA: hypothetical protein VH234_00760 [Candidatus Saccharimonadales bacterium]|jgi:hypothetical protein|nr:hypothetical protein [Candidatus Saccharimonadales bacterium]